MREAVQIMMAFLGAIGFGGLYNIRGRKLVVVGVGGMIGWMVYLWAFHACQDKVFSLFVGTIAVGVLAEVLARLLRTPVTILLVPMLVPMIPGSDLFYATSHLVLEDMEQARTFLSLVVRESAAIAFGIILITCAVQILHRFLHRGTGR